MEITIRSRSREEFIDITEEVQQALGARMTGICHLFVKHTSAALCIQENTDPGLHEDILELLRRIAPKDAGYRHDDGNADAHLKAALLGQSLSVPVEDGRLSLGTWQGVFLVELDGPRERTVRITLA